MTLDDVVEVFRRWLYLPDPRNLYVNLAAIAANGMTGDPVWLVNVGPPGGGKTETLNAMSRLPDVHLAATLTEASLLSGTPNGQKAPGAKGGLLRAIGDYGVLVLKDLGSVLAMNRDTRAAVLAALREIFDGSWTRHVGTDGGKTLHWEGKLGLLAGCTPAIDSHHAVMASMGERFALYRLPAIDGDAQAERAMANFGREAHMRHELAEAVAALFAGIRGLNLPPRTLDDAERYRIVDLANLAVRCRSSIERDPHTREIELVPEPEAPGRLAGVLSRMLAGLEAVDTPAEDTWAILRKLALDSMPAVRRAALEHLVAADATLETPEVAIGIGYPTTTARRALEELAAFGVVTRTRQGQGKPDRWTIAEWTWLRWAPDTVPEKSQAQGSVPEMSDGLNGSRRPPNSHIHVERDFSGTLQKGRQ